jgi:hypothetical protein
MYGSSQSTKIQEKSKCVLATYIIISPLSKHLYNSGLDVYFIAPNNIGLYRAILHIVVDYYSLSQYLLQLLN